MPNDTSSEHLSKVAVDTKNENNDNEVKSNKEDSKLTENEDGRSLNHKENGVASAIGSVSHQYEDVETRAMAKANFDADADYDPSPLVLNSSSPEPLLDSVDGISLESYNDNIPSIYSARSVPVPCRGKISIPIYITNAGSLIDYVVESKDYDIDFGIVAEREKNSVDVKATARIDSHLNKVTGKFIVGTVPCALNFIFSNEYSMFREKSITYKVTVRNPSKDIIRMGRKYRAQKALKIVSEDKVETTARLEEASKNVSTRKEKIDELKKRLEETEQELEKFEKEEELLKGMLSLRNEQENLLTTRLTCGWGDDPDGVIASPAQDRKDEEVEA